jgi:hypothetical protein
MRHLIPVHGHLQRKKRSGDGGVDFPAPGRKGRASDQAPEGALRDH